MVISTHSAMITTALIQEEVVPLVKAVLKPEMMPLNRLEMMPTKISREMPLPMPLSVMRSPIHMARAVPPAMDTPTST